jgi:hypothetical protein
MTLSTMLNNSVWGIGRLMLSSLMVTVIDSREFTSCAC